MNKTQPDNIQIHAPIPQIYALNHAPIPFYFSQNSRDFFVREIPLYPFSQQGEHLILEIRKKGLSTQEMLKILSSHLGCKDFGYAGLKDKSATTIQYISLHKSYAKNLSASLSSLEEKGIKVLSQTYHSNKIKLGHLRGNSFFIRLKKVHPSSALMLENVAQKILKNGLPNYFGYQRFGKFQNNHIEAIEILQKKRTCRNKTLKNFLFSSLQSYLFNLYLAKRITLSHILASFQNSELHTALKLEGFKGLDDAMLLKELKSQAHFFKILPGDVMEHYPRGKLFCTQDLKTDSNRFFNRAICPSAPLFGSKLFSAQDLVLELENETLHTHCPLNIPAIGARRYAWIYPEDLKTRYIQEKAHFELEFFLPKGSYATIFIQELAHRDILLD